MTCNKDCRNCIYGVPKTTFRCNSPNSTCAGECYKCPWSSDKQVKYYCTSGIAHGDC